MSVYFLGKVYTLVDSYNKYYLFTSFVTIFFLILNKIQKENPIFKKKFFDKV